VTARRIKERRFETAVFSSAISNRRSLKFLMNIPAYTWLLFAGVVISFLFWKRRARQDRRLVFIYGAALVGAFFGAKLVYLLAEGWLYFGAPDMWLQLAAGKSILGALLGGYVFVELAKRHLGYASTTGDDFALIAPISIGLGRVGCLLHGCCLGAVCSPGWYALKDADGVPRWPAVPTELAFNLFAFALFLFLRQRNLLPGQHFHLYLITYGLFRFAHEFVRATPRLLGPFSGYHFAALAVALFGAICFVRRQSASMLGTAKNNERPEGRPSPNLA
jgi:phosphatidylglycerol:prolipoprotein diacylglycerol transferase